MNVRLILLPLALLIAGCGTREGFSQPALGVPGEADAR